MSGIAVISAEELVRSRPAMFFENGVPTAAELTAAVIRDLADVGEFNARIRQEGSFSMVASDVDWLTSKHASLEQLFDRFVLPNSGRVNAHRAEVLLASVCEGVLALGKAPPYSLKLELNDIPESFLEEARTATRCLIWKFVSK